MKQLLCFAMALVLFTGCKTDEKNTNTNTNSDNYIIIGWFLGECGGDMCYRNFKITETSVFRDTDSSYPSWTENYEGDFELELPAAAFEAVQSLMTDIPAEVATTDSQVFDCPDCADGGGNLFEYHNGSVHKHFLFDVADYPAVPVALQPYFMLIEEHLEVLKTY
jgi:hypothetical protein